MTIKFTAAAIEGGHITQIAYRAAPIFANAGVEQSILETIMDLDACHSNGCPLDFEKLLAADEATFGHDLLGIRRHINRKTGELEDCFVPRTAKPLKEPQS